jgi:hypothetical protein
MQTFMVIGVIARIGAPPLALLARESGYGLLYAGEFPVLETGAALEDFWCAVRAAASDYPHVDVDDREAYWVRPHIRVELCGDGVRCLPAGSRGADAGAGAASLTA